MFLCVVRLSEKLFTFSFSLEPVGQFFNQTRRICKENSSFIKILLNGDNRGKAKIHIY